MLGAGTLCAAEDGPLVTSDGNGSKATVTVESTGRAVTVAQVTNRMMATGYGAGGTVTVAGASWKDICMTPCSFEMKPGLYELMVYGNGATGASNKFDLRGGPAKLRVEPGSAALSVGGMWLTAFGIVGVVLGGTFLAISDDKMAFQALPLTLISTGVTGLGIGMIYWGNTSFERVGSTGLPSAVGAAGHAPLGISLRTAM
jgi:hypothetical protein